MIYRYVNGRMDCFADFFCKKGLCGIQLPLYNMEYYCDILYFMYVPFGSRFRTKQICFTKSSILKKYKGNMRDISICL